MACRDGHSADADDLGEVTHIDLAGAPAAGSSKVQAATDVVHIGEMISGSYAIVPDAIQRAGVPAHALWRGGDPFQPVW